ncbi:MAG: hypothetical protein F6K14_21290 [Symploca sp. SIO2C1]|nr:hypothetical protein [Symploca sp. SIO2C1]
MDETNHSETYQSGFRAGYSDLWSQKWDEDKDKLIPQGLSPAEQEEWQQGYQDGQGKGLIDYASYADVVGISVNNLIFDSFL